MKGDRDIEKLFRQSEELTPRAELKQEILARVALEVQKKEGSARAVRPRRFRTVTALLAALLIVFSFAGTITVVQGASEQTVYIDVNPSLALNVNGFGKITDVQYLNEDARSVLSGTALIGLSAKEATEHVIVALDSAGYLDGEAEIYISTLTQKGKKEKKDKKAERLLKKMCKAAEQAKSKGRYTVNAAELSERDLQAAAENKLSPAKCQIIAEILEKDDQYTFAELAALSMKELKRIAKGK